MKNAKSFFSSFTGYSMAIQRGLLLLQILVFLIGLVFKKWLWAASVLVGGCALIFGVFTFCLTDTARAYKQFKTLC